MAEFQEEPITDGKTWIRGRSISFEYPLSPGLPKVSVELQKAIKVNDEVFMKFLGVYEKNLSISDWATSVPILNPETNTPAGPSYTYQELFVMLYSLFFHLGEEYLAKVSEEGAPPVDES